MEQSMEKKTVDVIIPAYRPGEGWKLLLRGLEGQTWPVHRLIVMNTGEENWEAAYETAAAGELPADGTVYEAV